MADDPFTVDAAPDPTWTCDVCNVTIKARDQLAIDVHKAGKKHQKAVRKAAAEAGLPPPPPPPPPQILQPDADPTGPWVPVSMASAKRKADDLLVGAEQQPQKGFNLGKAPRLEADKNAKLRTGDASTNAKSVLNEMCQMLGWSLSYTHHESQITQEGMSASREGFLSEITIDKEPRRSKNNNSAGGSSSGSSSSRVTYSGAWCPNKKAADASAAQIALTALESSQATGEFAAKEKGPTTSTRHGCGGYCASRRAATSS